MWLIFYFYFSLMRAIFEFGFLLKLPNFIKNIFVLKICILGNIFEARLARFLSQEGNKYIIKMVYLRSNKDLPIQNISSCVC